MAALLQAHHKNFPQQHSNSYILFLLYVWFGFNINAYIFFMFLYIYKGFFNAHFSIETLAVEFT